jgi:hypothetical protein
LIRGFLRRGLESAGSAKQRNKCGSRTQHE